MLKFLRHSFFLKNITEFFFANPPSSEGRLMTDYVLFFCPERLIQQCWGITSCRKIRLLVSQTFSRRYMFNIGLYFSVYILSLAYRSSYPSQSTRAEVWSYVILKKVGGRGKLEKSCACGSQKGQSARFISSLLVCQSDLKLNRINQGVTIKQLKFLVYSHFFLCRS